MNLYGFGTAKALMTLCFVAAALVIAPFAEAKSRKPFKGPVMASVVQVIDGDTFLADAHIWPGQSIRINIRIRGIDAPEMKSRCRGERAAALRARAALSGMIGQATVSISNIGSAKYYGRVLADVETETGETVRTALLDRQFVRPYAGGKRQGWCS